MMSRRQKIASIRALVFIIMMSFSLGSQAKDMSTHEYKLANGLKLIVREDHRAPVIVTQVWYKAGAADEIIGLTGRAHALEHMMFQGTDKFPGDTFSQTIAANGGQDNAFTGADYTAYYEALSADKLALTFELEADRMRGLKLDEKAFQNEMQVIMEERRLRTDDKPRAIAYERFMATANVAGPYHHPIIGWMEDIQQYKLADLKAWYDQFYQPNNATLVVVGAVEFEKVKTLAEQYFGPIPAGKLQPAYVRNALPALGEKRIELHKEKTLPYLLIGFDVPSFMSAEIQQEAYALLALSGILDGGESARFAKRLVREKQLVASASAYYEIYKRYDTQFILSATPAENQTLKAVETAFWQEIDDLKNNLLSEAELEKVKAQVIAHQVYEQDSMSEQAISIGLLETIGASWHEMDRLPQMIEKLTAADIQQVAQKYLVPERMTVATLMPVADNPKE